MCCCCCSAAFRSDCIGVEIGWTCTNIPCNLIPCAPVSGDGTAAACDAIASHRPFRSVLMPGGRCVDVVALSNRLPDDQGEVRGTEGGKKGVEENSRGRSPGPSSDIRHRRPDKLSSAGGQRGGADPPGATIGVKRGEWEQLSYLISEDEWEQLLYLISEDRSLRRCASSRCIDYRAFRSHGTSPPAPWSHRRAPADRASWRADGRYSCRGRD
jgi:hypothetical protein